MFSTVRVVLMCVLDYWKITSLCGEVNVWINLVSVFYDIGISICSSICCMLLIGIFPCASYLCCFTIISNSLLRLYALLSFNSLGKLLQKFIQNLLVYLDRELNYTNTPKFLGTLSSSFYHFNHISLYMPTCQRKWGKFQTH